MNRSLLAAIGSPNYERLGAAPHSVELRSVGQDGTALHEIGRRRLSLWQCFICLRWSRQTVETCDGCGRAKGAIR
jgi:hypothetical protein